MSGGSALPKLLLVAACVKVAVRANDGGAVFIREFTLSRRDHLPEQNPPELGQRPEDPVSAPTPSSRTARSEEDRDTLWDAWGSWSECSRTCGGGASYSLRRCLSSKSCEGQNIKYRTCGNVDCPPEAGDFRAQQCSAHADVRFQGRFHEWLPVYNDPENPCSLKCSAKDSGLVLELAPKVLDGTRCYTESLDMCISGACQIVGCDHELGSAAKEDNCGVCGGDGATCRLVRGHYRAQQDSGRGEDTVVVIPYRSRHVRLVLKGPDHLYVESQTLQGVLGELDLDESGLHHLENTTLDFQKLSDKEILRIAGPLGADFTIKVRLASGADTTVQYLYYQPIGHRWRETDFFPCSVTCGGGYQLTSAECLDVRSGRVVVDQYCHYYPENVKPKPKLQECNPEPCLASDGYKQLTPYDLYHPLPRWESSPWTSCSASCGGGVQSRSVSCVEEDVQGVVMATEEWKCLYAPKTDVLQPCNTFGCPSWLAQDWSPCTVSCGPGLRYRVVLCMDHRGLHAGGCQPSTKPPIKEECLVAVPCYKPADTLPVEAKPAWHKQAIELGGEEQEEQEEEEQEEVVVSEEPTFLPGPWRTCSRTCGAGIQQRAVRCRVLLRFSQTVADLPDHECEGVKPAAGRPCYRAPCPHVTDQEGEELHDWEYDGFTECSQSCGGGTQEAVIVCLNKRTGEAADQNLCVSARRPPQLLQACRSQPCPPRWVTGEWTSCSATCGVGLMTRSVECVHQPGRDSNRTGVLRDQDCQNLKPSPVQACNRFDCPPMWDPQDWGQCSSSCGRGVQTRRVRCKQRMADGSNLELPDTFCPSHSPPSQQACSQQECPPTWVAAGWSQCSVTCGSGVQRLRTSCQNQGSEVDPENCFWIPPPPRTRPCSPRPCDHVVKSDRTILAQNKVYVQWRKARKLHLVVGGHAYLLPWTTLLLRCPTRHFRKGRVRWLKDGKPLAGVPHVSVTALGHLKVQQVRPSDVGVYTCVAGSAHEHFVLQVLGSKRKVAAPEPRPQEAGPDGTFGREFWASLNRYDAFVEQLLELRRSLLEDAAKPGGKNKGNPEDGGSEPPGLFVLIADTYRLDRLLSDGGLGGPRAPQLVAQLFRQLTAAHGDANESTLHPPDGAESSTPAPFLFKPRIKAQTSKSPLIIQRPPKFQPPSADMVVAVGAPVLLQRPFSSLELSCEVLGSPEPSVTWTRNGKKLQQNGRVALMSSGSLKIQSPNKLDEGLYTCTARNRLGSASLSSWLQIIGGRGRHCDPAGPNGTNACSERKNSSHSAAPCSGPRCHHRWQAEPWSPCSASCGGGSQTRSVRCLTGSEGVWSEGGGPACLGAGRKPADARLCNQLPCARWGATHWGPCQGECVGPSLATQQRHLYCQDANGTKVPSRMCGSLPRPGVLKNCSTQACVLEWRVGAWTPCTATCGRHGFQSRPVTCAHVRSGKVAKEHQCAWKPRPPSWQRCNVQSCGRAGECQDSTRYCEKVRQLELCSLPQFQNRCCRSCRNT